MNSPTRNLSELSKMWGVPIGTVRRWALEDSTFPAPIQFGAGALGSGLVGRSRGRTATKYYRLSEVSAWYEKKTRKTE